MSYYSLPNEAKQSVLDNLGAGRLYPFAPKLSPNLVKHLKGLNLNLGGGYDESKIPMTETNKANYQASKQNYEKAQRKKCPCVVVICAGDTCTAGRTQVRRSTQPFQSCVNDYTYCYLEDLVQACLPAINAMSNFLFGHYNAVALCGNLNVGTTSSGSLRYAISYAKPGANELGMINRSARCGISFETTNPTHRGDVVLTVDPHTFRVLETRRTTGDQNLLSMGMHKLWYGCKNDNKFLQAVLLSMPSMTSSDDASEASSDFENDASPEYKLHPEFPGLGKWLVHQDPITRQYREVILTHNDYAENMDSYPTRSVEWCVKAPLL